MTIVEGDKRLWERVLIARAIREHGPSTRNELAEATGLSRATVSARLKEMIHFWEAKAEHHWDPETKRSGKRYALHG